MNPLHEEGKDYATLPAGRQADFLAPSSIAPPPAAKEDPRQPIFDSNYYIHVPWSGRYYFTVRGAENVHIYFWIAKDLCWAQDFVTAGLIFGGLALLWFVVLGYHAYASSNVEEAYMLVCTLLWLVGNFVWMEGELVNDDDYVQAPIGGHIFEAALGLLALYHFVLRPMGWIEPSPAQYKRYEDAGLYSRFKYFKSWRQYENMHTLCWLGKDWSWNQMDPYTWGVFLVPTVLIGIDFIVTTWRTRRMTIDCVHYIAQLLWVLGNMCWALTEIYGLGDSDDPAYLFGADPVFESQNGRWWASMCLLFAYIPLLGLYVIWLPLTILGRLDDASSHHDSTHLLDARVIDPVKNQIVVHRGQTAI